MNPISLASGVLPEFGPLDVVRAAAAAEFDFAGLWVEPPQWTPALLRDVKQALADAAMPLLDVEVAWLKPDSDMKDHQRLVDIGAELGAKNVLCVSSEPEPATTARRLHELCRRAEGSGLRIALEFGIFTTVKTLADARRIIDDVDHPLAAILVDPIHVDRSGTTAREIADTPRALFPYAQFCDAPAKRPNPANFDEIITDAIDLRRQPGEGALPLDDIIAALPAGVPLSIELRSKALRESFLDPVDRARAAANATRRWLARRRDR